ncbi:alcohol dehydrogenase-like regulatory protein ErcA [Sporomusa sp.]|uniref:alcohol dehydrogenase-like regulatory protein ErcA n=1 Tax=Sporomusa sp. TaxID=2078658 RepID=UPI002BF01277|nr:alcohol dehydrogenase-like regulatory protein ErcA [Sporomusa sp.]HWR43370.1 alcohol dehydrogenase-like regulatory protein ErcA [Sporomusa sp.]
MAVSILELRKFVVPEFIFGLGAIELAGQYAENFGARKAMIVTDPGIIKSGWLEPVVRSLEKHSLPYVIFQDVHVNPRDYDVMAGARIYQDYGCNLLLAVGGGSPLDCAKGIGIVSSNERHITEFEGVDQVISPMPPLICIPTTAGSSADVSQFAIIADSTRKTKMAIVSKALVPDVALIDPVTLTTMPPYLTACTGLDALCHAIEALVSTASSPLTDLHALKAVDLLFNHLPLSLRYPENIEYRGYTMLGSLSAGMAFSNAILGAVHAMSHSLGGMFDLPHGECNAILLTHVMAYNFPACREGYEKIGAAMGLKLGGLSTSEREALILSEIDLFREQLGVTRTLKDIGVTEDDIPLLAQSAYLDPCLATNPREATIRDIEEIFRHAL